MTTAPATASTREAYGQTLLELGKENQDLVVLGGDLNKSTFTHLFAAEHPDRFFDFGPAEQNMMGVAAGLAASGKLPFVSTFAVFGTGRPFDQLRVSIAQPHLNVKIVCTHAGLLTGEDGMSAQSIEDLALACSLPGFTVVAPCDAEETRQAVRTAAATDGPFYIRLYRPATPVVHSSDYAFQLGKAEEVAPGQDVTIIATGAMVPVALRASANLLEQGTRVRVLNMHTLQPADQEGVLKAARETGAVVTAEEHYAHGGLGSIIGRILGQNLPVPLEVVSLSGYAESGQPAQLLAKYGLDVSDLEEAVRRAIQRKRG